MNPYEKLMARKRKWTPVQTTAGTCPQGAEEAIYRALAAYGTPVGILLAMPSILKYQRWHAKYCAKRQGRRKPRHRTWLYRQCLRC